MPNRCPITSQLIALKALVPGGRESHQPDAALGASIIFLALFLSIVQLIAAQQGVIWDFGIYWHIAKYAITLVAVAFVVVSVCGWVAFFRGELRRGRS